MRQVFCAAVLLALSAAVPTAQQGNDFRWSGTVERGRILEIKGVHGNVRAELASGSEVQVFASKRARHSDIGDVSVQVVQENGNVTICAVYPTPVSWSWLGRSREQEPNECRPGAGGRMNVRNNDVSVDFTVRVPDGVHFVARTVNGGIVAHGLRSDVKLKTVNGRIQTSTSGTASAHTVNGSIDAAIGSAGGTEPLAFRTVNGSINLRVPKNINANLRANTVNGRFDSEAPLMVRSFSRRNKKVEGTLGSGGRDLELQTVNGSIHLQLNPNN